MFVPASHEADEEFPRFNQDGKISRTRSEDGGIAEITGIASLNLAGCCVGCGFLLLTYNCFVEKQFLQSQNTMLCSWL